tara:strand:+ start:104 stop:616 length:513 start_codon:yes stop_codon:yes gene_type:complete
MTSIVTQQPPTQNKNKQQKIAEKINEALAKSDFEIAKAAYEKCLEDCKNSEDYRQIIKGPPNKVMMMNPRRRREKNRARMISYKKAKINYENCVRQCNNDWYLAVIGLIGQKNQNVNEDVLRKILEMLKEKDKKRSKNKMGGRKTRRKKGTNRGKKSRKRSKRRKSKRRN